MNIRRRYPTRRHRLGAVLAVLLLTLPFTATPATATPAPADPEPGQRASVTSTLPYQLIAKARPDECFNGIGVVYPAGPPCAQGQPKVNQAYVWGLAQVGTRVWFGTGANVHCVVQGATLGEPQPVAIPDYVCEYGESQIVKQNPIVPAAVGDQRRPEVFYFDQTTRTVVRKTTDIENASAADQLRLRATLGLRAGGAFNNVVLFGGPGLNNSINLFAFNGTTGAFLGSTNLTAYGNIRHFVVAEGALYAGVGIGRNGEDGGQVLRWTGSLTNPFSFVTVANLPAQAADLTYFKGRIYVSSWSTALASTPQQTAGLWMSPLLADGQPGLVAGDAGSWRQVWHARMYEPDPVIAGTYGLGGLAAFGDYLYWGTMHVPLKSAFALRLRYPQPSDEANCQLLKSSLRAAVVFRGRDFGATNQQVDLLYGASELSTYDPAANAGVGGWVNRPTNYTPLYGSQGIGNGYNNYLWKMTVAGGKLFVGTMDWSYLLKGRLGSGRCGHDMGEYNDYGGDLWMFSTPDGPGTPVDTVGVGNYLNYGIRNMLADGSRLYLGMANPMNLRTDPNDAVPEGGWELIEMTVG
ncbi:hypothetical protein [Plantactinospora sp. DSM 117369]